MINAPDTWYIVITDFGEKIGIGNLTEGFPDLEDVLTALNEYHRTDGEVPVFRIFRVDMDVKTNMSESIADVTEDVIEEYYADGWGN